MQVFGFPSSINWPFASKPKGFFSWPLTAGAQAPWLRFVTKAPKRIPLSLPFMRSARVSASPLQRAVNIVIPFLKLNPKAKALVQVAGATKIGVTGLVELARDWRTAKPDVIASKLWQTSLATCQIASRVLNLPLLKLVTLAVFMLKEGHLCYVAFSSGGKKGDRGIAALELLDTIICLALALTGVPQLVLASFAFALGAQLYRARHEFTKGRKPEAVAALILAALLAVQGGQYFASTKSHRNSVNARILKGKQTSFLKNHPLNDLQKAAAEHSVRRGDVNLGAHFGQLGGEAVKGSNITLHNGEELSLKVNHVHRERMQQVIDEYQAMEPDELNSFASAQGICEGNLKIEKGSLAYASGISEADTLRDAYKLTCQGIGSVSVGARPDIHSLYDRVEVQVDKQKEGADAHMLLSLMGLDGALKPSTADEMERMKLGQLFRIHYPTEATALERTPGFFSQGLDSLKDTMVKMAPGMRERLETDLPQMQLTEQLPGRVRYELPTLAAEAKKLGAVALMFGVNEEPSTAFERVASMLQTGALSSQLRFQSGMNALGLSSLRDHRRGSEDSVFTRLLVDRPDVDLTRFSASGPVQLIYSLGALNSGTYQYHGDHGGTRQRDSYLYYMRPSLERFVKEERDKPSPVNEVMVKDIIAPSRIIGCAVPNEEYRQGLLAALKRRGIAVQNDFIHVGSKLSSAILARWQKR